MFVTSAGIAIDFNALQLAKAPSPIDFTEAGISMLFIFIQFANASNPIAATVLGITTLPENPSGHLMISAPFLS